MGSKGTLRERESSDAVSQREKLEIDTDVIQVQVGPSRERTAVGKCSVEYACASARQVTSTVFPRCAFFCFLGSQPKLKS